jgi:hypothetical protein
MPVRNMIHATKQAKPMSPTCCKRETVDGDRPSAEGRRNNTLNHKKPASQGCHDTDDNGHHVVLMTSNYYSSPNAIRRRHADPRYGRCGCRDRFPAHARRGFVNVEE